MQKQTKKSIHNSGEGAEKGERWLTTNDKAVDVYASR